nr:MAG TPA: hypothetical protein [Caudoviricetes sp.]
MRKRKSTSKIVGAINEVLRVRMYHSRNTLLTKSIMPHPSSIYKFFIGNI